MATCLARSRQQHQYEDPAHVSGLKLCLLQDILTESFDPIVELTTGADLMMAMVYAQELGDWDYSGMYTAVLKFKVHLS